MINSSQKELGKIYTEMLCENRELGNHIFTELDFTPEILKIIKRAGYKRHSPKYDRRSKHDKLSPEEQSEQMNWYKTNWQYWVSPLGEIVDANKMFSDLNIQ